MHEGDEHVKQSIAGTCQKDRLTSVTFRQGLNPGPAVKYARASTRQDTFVPIRLIQGIKRL
jgi:hypothetical protein